MGGSRFLVDTSARLGFVFCLTGRWESSLYLICTIHNYRHSGFSFCSVRRCSSVLHSTVRFIDVGFSSVLAFSIFHANESCLFASRKRYRIHSCLCYMIASVCRADWSVKPVVAVV
jgi:hypothetical protein